MVKDPFDDQLDIRVIHDREEVGAKTTIWRARQDKRNRYRSGSAGGGSRETAARLNFFHRSRTRVEREERGHSPAKKYPTACGREDPDKKTRRGELICMLVARYRVECL